MPHYFTPPHFSHEQQAAAGVLVVNLGTPDAPTLGAVRRYLAEFLSDPRIIELPRWLWWLILHGVILRLRPRRSARAYAKIWTIAGSPLMTGTQELAEHLQKSITKKLPGPIHVRFAMRYGKPAIRVALRELAAAGVRRLIVLPLYPQFSATTTASVFDAITAEFRHWRWPPELRFINDYFAEPAYIEALAKSVESYWRAHGRGERLLLSFHGIPERYFRAGDPYFCHCQATARFLRERLGLTTEQLLVSFQSRVGREPWLSPYTDVTLTALAAQGVKHVQVLCPGFAVDCLETLEEIALVNREHFLKAGGIRFDYIPALNASVEHIAALTQLVLRHGQGWAEFNPHP